MFNIFKKKTIIEEYTPIVNNKIDIEDIIRDPLQIAVRKILHELDILQPFEEFSEEINDVVSSEVKNSILKSLNKYIGEIK